MYDLSDWNVVIVDDEPDNRGVLEFVLSSYNATVRTAATGQQCLEMMEQKAPTLLLADIQMAGMSGMELLEKVRAHAAWNSIPVIAITAFAMPGDRERILGAGFTGYISKPLSVMKLVDQIKAVISEKVEL
jgi:CheY-like chemotaxis protein